jgi:mono/diheme cytochrome c family protein
MKIQLPLLVFILIFITFSNNCQSNPYAQSEGLYNHYCANCHMEDGTGLKGLIPPLKGADYLQADPLRAACIIRYGMNSPVTVNDTTYTQPMPAIPERELSDFEITNILNYINQAWGNDFGYVQYESVKKKLESCSK